MDPVVLVIFLVVYTGMFLGRLPGLALDRTGIALLGMIALLAAGRLSPGEAWSAIDVGTIGMLLGMMIVSAQFRLGGFYARVTHRLAEARVSPPMLLALLITVAAGLSALLTNDIVCLAMAPALAEGCVRRRLTPVPFLLGLACAANVGSAATLIGNPQNILIGQTLGMSFAGYLIQALPPVVLGLVATWSIIVASVRGHWESDISVPHAEEPVFNPWQTGKGLVVLGALVFAFLFASWPREVVALAAAGVLLSSRRIHTGAIMSLIDWPLLVLFAGLFVVNHALATSGNLDHVMNGVRALGVDFERPAPLFVGVVVLSNIVSNVPAVMLMLPMARHPVDGAILALASTLAGNLLIVGSIANIIVVDQAARLGIRISWREHARVGIPVTAATLAIAAVWMMVILG